jgi:hypothetical protein
VSPPAPTTAGPAEAETTALGTPTPAAASTAPSTLAPVDGGRLAGNTIPAVRVAEPAAADDRQLVLDILQKYRRAYDSLAADEVSDVWPTVNRDALARAFGGLSVQSLTFHACDVDLQSAGATAFCRGTTRYVPKIGSREPRVEPRTWTFRLAKRGSSWTIEDARAAR